METSVEQKIEETFKQMPKEQYPLAKAYALSEAQEFDNYNADWGNSEYDKIRAYKDLKQNYPEEVVKAVEKMVNDNTYTQSKDENKVYVANIVGILNNIEKKQDQNINQENSNLQTTIEKPKQEEIIEPKNIENINNQYNAIVKEMTEIKHFIDYDFYPEVNQFELEEEVNRKIENLSKESDVSIEDISKKLETDVEENFRISTLSNKTKNFELLNNQQQAIELKPGNIIHYKDMMFEVLGFDKEKGADRNGEDTVVLKNLSYGVNTSMIKSDLEQLIANGSYKLIAKDNVSKQDIHNSMVEHYSNELKRKEEAILNKNRQAREANDTMPYFRRSNLEFNNSLHQPHSEKQTNDLEVKVGQKFQLKEDNSVLEVVRIDKNAHRDGSDELIMKPIGVNVGNKEFNWSQKALESGLKEGKITDVTNVQQLSEKQFTQLNYLKNQVKYLGMGESEKLHKDLENAILSPDKNVDVKVEYNNPDKLMKGNTISFDLHIGKGEQGGVFLNSYTANLTMKNGEERSQSFKVQKENNITAKEAINLLEGRAVKIEHDRVDKETGELSRTESFIKLKLKDEKTEYGNYKYEWYNKGYGVDVDDIMNKSNLVFADDTQRERTKKHLEKGNITEVSFVHDKKEIKGFAVLNPQYKQLNLYDSTMNRLNTNKPLQKPELENNQKNEIVKEQHISRGH
jgi:hypothetical protein